MDKSNDDWVERVLVEVEKDFSEKGWRTVFPADQDQVREMVNETDILVDIVDETDERWGLFYWMVKCTDKLCRYRYVEKRCTACLNKNAGQFLHENIEAATGEPWIPVSRAKEVDEEKTAQIVEYIKSLEESAQIGLNYAGIRLTTATVMIQILTDLVNTLLEIIKLPNSKEDLLKSLQRVMND